MTIIDVRCRLSFGESGEYFRQSMGGRAPAVLREGTLEAFLRELDRAGITTAVPASGNNQGMTLGKDLVPPRRTSNDEQARLQEQFPGRILGVAAIDVGGAVHDPVAELERCIGELGLKVVTIEPGRAPMLAPNPADERLYPFYERLQSAGVPLILQTSGMKGGKNIDYGHPRWVDQVADDFPDLHIVCAHGCYPYVREMIAVAIRRPNVWAAPDMYTLRIGSADWVQAVNSRWLARKFLFGSAFPCTGDLAAFVRRFRALGWRREVLDQVMYRNAIEALRLQGDPVFGPIYRQPYVYNRPRLLQLAYAAGRKLMRQAGPA